MSLVVGYFMSNLIKNVKNSPSNNLNKLILPRNLQKCISKKELMNIHDKEYFIYDDINEVEETPNENDCFGRYYFDDLEADALPEEYTYGLYKFKEGYLYAEIDYNDNSSNMQIKRYKIISGKIVDENKINIILEGNITCDIYSLYSESVYDIPRQLFLTFNFVLDQDIVKWDKTKEIKNLKISKKFGYLFADI